MHVSWSRWRPAGRSATRAWEPAPWRPVAITAGPGQVPAAASRPPLQARRGRARLALLPAAAGVGLLAAWAQWGAPQPLAATVAGEARPTPTGAVQAGLAGGPNPGFAAVSASALRAALLAAPARTATRAGLPPQGGVGRMASGPLLGAATATGLPLALLAAVAQEESQGQARAVSPAGALGLMQLMPSTAAALGVRNAFDPAQNALGGARYLKQRLLAYGGGRPYCVTNPLDCPATLRLALAAYNAGPGAVQRFHGVPPYPETRRYVRAVITLYRQNLHPG